MKWPSLPSLVKSYQLVVENKAMQLLSNPVILYIAWKLWGKNYFLVNIAQTKGIIVLV